MTEIQSFGDNMRNFAILVTSCTAIGAVTGEALAAQDTLDMNAGRPPMLPRANAEIGARVGAGIGLLMSAWSLGAQFVTLYKERE